jgi:hypothetical protein
MDKKPKPFGHDNHAYNMHMGRSVQDTELSLFTEDLQYFHNRAADDEMRI